MVTLDHEVVGNGQTLTGTDSDLFSRKEGSKIRDATSGGIPPPLSLTETRTNLSSSTLVSTRFAQGLRFSGL